MHERRHAYSPGFSYLGKFRGEYEWWLIREAFAENEDVFVRHSWGKDWERQKEQRRSEFGHIGLGSGIRVMYSPAVSKKPHNVPWVDDYCD